MTTPIDERPETLSQFSALLPGWAFEETVTGLYTVRAQIKAVENRRKELYDLIVKYHSSGRKAVAVSRTTGFALHEVPSRPRTGGKPTVTSQRLKSWNPGLWRQCLRPKPWVSVKFDVPSPPEVTPPFRLPAVPRFGSSDEAMISAIRAYESLVVPKELRDQEKEHKAHLEKVAAEFGWDGLPILFADRWRVGLRDMRYDSAILQREHPDVFEKLAEVPVPAAGSGVSGRIVVAELSPDEIEFAD